MLREQLVRDNLYNILQVYIQIIFYKQNYGNIEQLLPLIDSIYKLFDSNCKLLQISGIDILDYFEKNNFNIDTTIDDIINNYYEIVEEV